MNPRTFVGLALVTLIVTVAAIVAVLGRPTSAPVQYVDEPAFPELRADPDAIAKVTLSTADGSFSLLRETAGRWVAPEHFGYPVDGAKVRDLIVALADMRLIERKTALPERYGRLEVEDLDAEEAKSRLLRLETADGEVRAEVLIGKERLRLTGTESSGTYLRRPGEADSWLASGSVRIAPAVVDWLVPEVVDLDPGRVHRIEIRRADEPSYVVRRAAAGEAFHLVGIAAGETLKEDADLARLGAALAMVRLEDVRPRDQLAWPAAHHTARFRTTDGLEVTVQLAEIDDQYWARFEARDVQPVAAPTSAQSPPPGEGAAEEAPAVAGDDGEGPPAAAEGGEAAAEAEPEPDDAAALNARLGKWAYRIPADVFEELTAARSTWVGDGTS